MNHNTVKHTHIFISKPKDEEYGYFIIYFLIPLFYGLIGLFFFFFFIDNILAFSPAVGLTDYNVSFVGFIFGYLIGVIQGIVKRSKKYS